MARLDDLTILLTMVDKTGKAFKSVDKKLARLQKITKVITGTAKIMGKTLAAAFVAAAVKGAIFTNGLVGMSRSTKETLRETQALFLGVQELSPSANIDSMSEALITLKERFADAAIGTGPLKGLIDDFEGFELDLGVDNSRDQLANFLEQVSKLPKANQRIFALKEVMSDTEANMFLPAVNGDIEKLDGLLKNLRTNIEDLPNVMSASDAQNVKDAKNEVSSLNIAWQNFSNVVYQLVAPALGAIVKLFTWALNKATVLTEKIKTMFKIGQDSAKDILKLDDPVSSQGQAEQLTSIQNRINLIQDEIEEKQRLQTIQTGSDFQKAQQRAKAAEMAKQEIKLAEDINLLLQRRAELEAMVFDRGVAGDPPAINIPTLNPVGENPVPDQPELESQGDSLEKGYMAARVSEMQEAMEAMQQMRDSVASGIIKNAALVREALAKTQNEAQERAVKIQNALLSVGNAFGQMADLAANKSEKSFKVFKRIQIALATVAAYSAAVQSLSEAKGDPLLRIAAYAQILSVGLGAIGQMRAVNVGGSGGGATGSTSEAGSESAQTTARGGTLQQETRSAGKTIIQLEGRDRTYDQTDIENITDALRQSGADIEVLYNS